MIGDLTSLKARLGITDNTKDAELTVILEDVTAWIESRTCEAFSNQEETETISGEGEDCIFLSRSGIRFTNYGIDTHVKVDGSLIDESDLYFGSNHVELVNGDCFEEGKRNVEIKYNYGYINIPADIKTVAERMAAARYGSSGGTTTAANSGETFVKSKKAGDITVTYDLVSKSNTTTQSSGYDDLSVSDLEIIDSYSYSKAIISQ